jgi:hypothetical protein
MPKIRVKAETAAQLVRKRIFYGDHALTGIPSERTMAKEFGISRETLRGALRLLEKEGVLVRQANGRLVVAPKWQLTDKRPIIGFLKHSNSSHDHELWREGVRGALEGRSCILRTVTFEHYGDAAIAGALEGFDGVFFLPPAEDIPSWLASKMRQADAKVVVVDQDATASGLRSVVMFPPQAERKLLEHLVQLGHRRIDCLNTQARDRIIEGRIDTWRAFLKERNLMGQLHSLTELNLFNSSYQLIKSRLREGRSIGAALICTTGPAALGVMRAFYEEGVRVSRDVSVCAVNDEGLGPFLTPSLTCLQAEARAGYLQNAVEWMCGQEWTGPLLVQPNDVPMFVGESTGPAPANTNVIVLGPKERVSAEAEENGIAPALARAI